MTSIFEGEGRSTLQNKARNFKQNSQMSFHQEFQVPKMEVLNLIRLFWGWVFPGIRLTYSLCRFLYLHFRYLKSLVIIWVLGTQSFKPFFPSNFLVFQQRNDSQPEKTEKTTRRRRIFFCFFFDVGDHQRPWQRWDYVGVEFRFFFGFLKARDDEGERLVF